MFNKKLKNKVSNLELNDRNFKRSWDSMDRAIRELYERINKFERGGNYLDQRMKQKIEIIEDSISLIARTLDANNIGRACAHCGNLLPKDN